MKNTIPPLVALPFGFARAAPPFEGHDICFPDSLARYWIGRLSRPGARVFDPFAGLGTTLFAAEEMGRVPYGIEYDGRRHGWVAGQLAHWGHLIHGDGARMGTYGLPKMDLCVTSPPFMGRGHRWNPLYAGDPAHAGYDAYLRRLGLIFGRIAAVMKSGAHVVLQVDNVPGRPFTPLVRDVGRAAEKCLRPAGETVVLWEGGRPDYTHTHCLVFKKQ